VLSCEQLGQAKSEEDEMEKFTVYYRKAKKSKEFQTESMSKEQALESAATLRKHGIAYVSIRKSIS